MFLLWLVAALGKLATVTALPTITAYGNRFFTSEGKRFIMRGADQCRLDAQLMKTLGVNVIRVYHVDPALDHSRRMAEFAGAGIYTLVDLDTFDTYILPNRPSWTRSQYERYTAVLDAFSSFDNSLGFFVGNEIISISNHSLAAPWIKAAARDIKAYRDAQGYRKFRIGYSAADIAELRPVLQDYLTCGGNASQAVDFFALNSYSWCDPSGYVQSGYASLEAQARDFPVPIFFSETGCNIPGPRLFDDQRAILGPEMAGDWSGSLVYEWIQEQNHYGLVSYGPPTDPAIVATNIKGGFTRKGTLTPVAPDFENLRSQWARIPTAAWGASRSDYTPAVSTRARPASTAGGWLVDGDVALPTLAGTGNVSAPVPTEELTPGPASISPTASRESGTASLPGRHDWTVMHAIVATAFFFLVLQG